MNCWEFMKCGREKGGAKATDLGICPAYPDHGRHCARVAGLPEVRLLQQQTL